MAQVYSEWAGPAIDIEDMVPKDEDCRRHLSENARLADERLRESPLHKIKGFLTPSVRQG
jgi:hypothetical protein